MLEEEDEVGDLEEVPTPPDGGWGWMVVFGSFMIHIMADGFTYTLGIFYVYLLNYFDATKAEAAWIVSILVGVTLGSGPLSGALVNRWGCRAVTIGGSLLASLMLFVSIYAETITVLYFTIGMGAGLGFGLIYLPAIVCVTGYFEKKRSFATGIAVCGSGVGTFAFSPLAAWLISYYNWKGALIIISGLMLNCVVFGALFRPLPKPKKRRAVRLRPVSFHSTACSVEPPSPHLPRAPLPSIQRERSSGPHVTYEVTEEEEFRKNLSETCLEQPREQKHKERIRYLSVSATGGHHPDLHPVDIHRIASHGSLNPVLATIRRGEAGLRTTASQPLFAHQPHHHHSHPAKIGSSHPGLHFRKDGHGSHGLLTEHRKDTNSSRSSMRAEDVASEPGKKCGCSPAVMDTIHSYLDLSLLMDPIFLIFAASNFLTSIGFNAPYVFIPDRASEDYGFSADYAAVLLSVVGISNTVSRVLLGYVSDLPFVNRLHLYNAALTVCGVGTCLSVWMPSWAGQVFYSALFGATSGAYVGLTSVVLVDLMGMERMTNAFGLLLLFQGVASVVGAPLCGLLHSPTHGYAGTFLLAGAMIAVSGIMLFAVPCVQRYLERRRQRQLRKPA